MQMQTQSGCVPSHILISETLAHFGTSTVRAPVVRRWAAGVAQAQAQLRLGFVDGQVKVVCSVKARWLGCPRPSPGADC